MEDLTKSKELWLLSYYRVSEISGALFFGRLAKSLKSGPIQSDITRHFADESLHAWYWTDCINRLGCQPVKLPHTYQEQYLATAGLPANLMEVLAVTQVFERRVIGGYAVHRRVPNLHPQVRETLSVIMQDEKRHICWIRNALHAMEAEYGAERVGATVARYVAADREVYRETILEHAEQLKDYVQFKTR